MAGGRAKRPLPDATCSRLGRRRYPDSARVHWLLPIHIRIFAQDTRLDKRADVEPNAVVQVRFPANGRLRQRLPSDEDVKGRFPFGDEFQSPLQVACGCKAGIAAAFPALHAGFLARYPIAEVRVNQLVQQGMVELVIVHPCAKAVLPSIPQMPDERTLMKASPMLFREAVAQPTLHAFAGIAGLCKKLAFISRAPRRAKGGGQQGAEPILCRLLLTRRRDANNTVIIGQRFKAIRFKRGTVGEAGTGLTRPPAPAISPFTPPLLTSNSRRSVTR